MSRLTETIALLYSMQDDDIRQLEQQLLDARKRAWSTALTDEARRHGCSRTPNAPRRGDLAELRRMSREDAQNIARTWNREVKAEIERLFEVNQRGNRNYYFSNLEKWSQKRDTWKLAQISVNTETTTRQYARDQFARKNNLEGGKWKFVGPAPVCAQCARLYGMGYVSRKVVDRYGHQQHIGCVHEFVEVKPEKLDCGDLWLG